MSNEKSKKLIFINPWKLFNGAFVPNWLLVRKASVNKNNEGVGISQGAKLCYARLSQFAGKKGWCHPKQKTLANEIGVTVRQIQDYLNELERLELILSSRDGYRGAKAYRFLSHDWMGEDTNNSSCVKTNRSSCLEAKDCSGLYIRKDSDIKDSSLKESAYLKRIDEFFNNQDQNWLNEIKRAFPKADLPSEFSLMRAWLVSNPEKEKKNLKRFCMNWLNSPKTDPPAKPVAGSGKTYVQVTDSWLHARLGNIATKDMIKAVMREIPENVWWKVDQFLKRAYPGSHGAGFAEVERELTAEARKNREEFSALAKSIGK